MHLDVSPCQVVTGCFLPTSKSDGALLSTNTSTGLWFPSKKHFSIDTPGWVSLKPAASPTRVSPQQCIPGRMVCQLLANFFVPRTSLPVSQAARASGSRGFGNETWQLDLCGRHKQSTVSVLSYFYKNNRKMMFPEPSFPSNAIIKWPKDKNPCV